MYWEQNSLSQKQGTLEENALKAQYISVQDAAGAALSKCTLH